MGRLRHPFAEPTVMLSRFKREAFFHSNAFCIMELRSEFSSNSLTRIHVYELRIGMTVCRLETLNNESPFFFDRMEIKTQADIQAVQSVCDYVYIDANWQKKFTGAIPTRKSEAPQQLRFARSFDQAASSVKNATNLIKTAMDDIRFGNPLNVEAVKVAVADCVDNILDNPEAMLLLTQLKERDEYTSQHSMNVCILSVLLGRELQLSNFELNQLGLCGLMHDIGKARVPLEILNKPDKLDEAEMVQMRKHTVYGRDVLMSARNIYPGAVDVAFAHHEHVNGSGYPRGIADTGLSMFTKIVAIVDAYDATTSNRCYQEGKNHLVAIGILVKAMNSRFESAYVTKFINCIGFYPQGNLVELSTGELAIVVEQNPKDRLKPKLLLIRDKYKQACRESIIDLSLNPIDADNNSYKITQIASAQEFGIDLREYVEKGVFTKAHPVV